MTLIILRRPVPASRGIKRGHVTAVFQHCHAARYLVWFPDIVLIGETNISRRLRQVTNELHEICGKPFLRAFVHGDLSAVIGTKTRKDGTGLIR